MADGVVDVADGAEEAVGNVFVYPLLAVREDPYGTSYAFTGSVRFRGHEGMLDLTIRDIEVRVQDGTARIDVTDPYEPGVRLLFASGRAVDDRESLTVAPTLTEDGSELFFYRYMTGFELDPIRIVVHPPIDSPGDGRDTADADTAGE